MTGKKLYLSTNVYDAAIARLEYLFDHFDGICFSFSGGKDSSVLVQLGALVARRKKKKFSVLFIDLEAMYSLTIEHVAEVRDAIKDVCDNFYWACLPLIEENSLSALMPEFITWDKSSKDVWIRDIPSGVITEDNNPFPFYDGLMSFEDFTHKFALWFAAKHHNTVNIIGIRTDESLRRFIAIISEGKETYEGKKWTTKQPKNYLAYPIYDWHVKDVWGAVAHADLLYNKSYDYMEKCGVPLSKQRICQPFGTAQKAGLDQFRVIEPETWEKMLKRVSGVNFGAIYCRTALLGQIKSYKPKHMTWEQYAVFLLESIGIYEPKIMHRYYAKIKYYLKWEEKNHGYSYGKVPDGVMDRKHGSWQNIARGLEKNDFYLTHLSFGIDKAGDRLLCELREKHKQIADNTLPPKVLKTIQNGLS